MLHGGGSSKYLHVAERGLVSADYPDSERREGGANEGATRSNKS